MNAPGILLAVEESELSAAYRVLQELILADHPVVRRHILAALHDLPLRDLQRFVDHASGALIAATVSPEEVEAPDVALNKRLYGILSDTWTESMDAPVGAKVLHFLSRSADRLAALAATR